MNKRIKQIITLFFIGIYFVSAMQGIANATSPKAYEYEITTLKKLGIIDEELDAQSAVVRSILFDAVARIASNGALDTQTQERTEFIDIPSDYDYYNAIRYLYENNIIKGNTMSAINPDGVVVSADIAVLMLRLLGYETVATLNGGYPYGYLNIANSSGLFKGVDFESAAQLNFGEMCKIIYNAMHMETMVITAVSDENAEYKKSGKTLLEVRMNILAFDGIVTSNGITSIGNIDAMENVCTVEKNGNTIKFNDQGNLSEGLLGKRVQLYAYQLENDEYLIKAINQYKTTVIKIDGNDIVNSTDNTICYNDTNDNQKALKISPKADAVKNGMYLDNFTIEQLIPSNGYIVLVDNNEDKIYDYIEITNYYDLVVGSVYIEGGVIIDAFDTSKVLRLEEDEYKIYKNGVRISLSDVKKDNVLSVAKAQMKNGSVFYHIYVTDNVLTGVLEELNEIDKTFKFAGEIYSVSSSKFDELQELVKIGDNYKFYFNFEQYITQIKTETETSAFAFLIKVSTAKGIDDTLQMKLFDSTGKILIFNASNRLTVDGYVCATSSSVIQRLLVQKNNTASADFEPRLIKYKLNSEGEINFIETDAPNKGNNSEDNDLYLRLNYDRIGETYAARAKSFRGDFLMDNKTLVFSIPKDLTLDKGYQMKTLSDFVDSNKYDIKVYNVDQDNGLAKYIVTSVDATNISYQVKLSVFEKKTKTVDADGAEQYKLYFSSDTGNAAGVLSVNAQEYVFNIVNDLEKGDAVRYTVDNASGEIVHVERLLKVSQSAKASSLGILPSSLTTTAIRPYDYNTTYTGAYIYKPSIAYGVPLTIKDNILRMQFAEKCENDYLKHLIWGETAPKLNTFYYNASNPSQIQVVTISDDGAIKIKKMTDFSELKTVSATGDYFEASRILIKVYDGIVQDVIIYNFPASKNATVLQ